MWIDSQSNGFLKQHEKVRFVLPLWKQVRSRTFPIFILAHGNNDPYLCHSSRILLTSIVVSGIANIIIKSHQHRRQAPSS